MANVEYMEYNRLTDIRKTSRLVLKTRISSIITFEHKPYINDIQSKARVCVDV